MRREEGRRMRKERERVDKRGGERELGGRRNGLASNILTVAPPLTVAWPRDAQPK